MSLRVRLITSVIFVLLASLCIGGAAAYWHAVRSVQTEMQAMLTVSVQTLRNGLEQWAEARAPQDEIERLVHGFDGDRHVRVVLRDGSGRVRVGSTVPALAQGVPKWFVGLFAPSLPPARLDLDDGGRITVEPDPRNEIGEVWAQLQDDIVVVGLSAGLSIILIFLVVGRALRPLDRLSAALASVGSGEYAVRVERVGPPELARLAQGFNAMAERLDAAHARNVRLNEQLLSLQAEERTELARDLHDEVGPFLFAVSLDTVSIERAAEAGRIVEVSERARSIREAVGHMQRHVRAMLLRLRPVSPVEAGLTPALERLVAFWRARQPAINFVLDVSVDEGGLDDPVMEAIYRLVQEGLNNAVRHGHAQRIEVRVEAGEAGEVVVRVADNGTGLSMTDTAGLGIMGMRERVEGLGGTLQIGGGGNSAGFVVTARLPCMATLVDA